MTIRLSDSFSYRRLLRFVLPSVVMMIVTSIYSIVDGFFVSNFVGKSAFAAVNFVMPVTMALGAFGFMIGTGGSALVAKTLGEKETAKANQYFSLLIYATLIIGILLSTLGIIFLRPIAGFLGASGNLLDDCVLYGRILLMSNTAFMLQNAFQSFLVAAEKPSFGLVVSVLAGIMNMVLDFLLVYVLPWGLAGAAIATAASEILGAAIPFIYFCLAKDTPLHLTKTHFNRYALIKSCTNGSSEMLSNLAASFIGMLYNFQLMRLAGEDGVAAYGVIMYVGFIFAAFFFGFTIGSSPIISYHYGAGNRRELANLFRKCLVITVTASLMMTLSAELLVQPFSAIFVGYDAPLLAMTCQAGRLGAFAFLFMGCNVFGSAFFTALNNGFLSAVISFLRTLVFETAAVIVLPLWLDLNGIWLSLPAAEAAAFILTVALLLAKGPHYGYLTLKRA